MIYLAFVGQVNTTSGTPNTHTRRMSRHGFITAFTTNAKRNYFVENYYHINNEAIAGNRNSLRGYCLGMSLEMYNDYIDGVEIDEY